MILCNDGFKYRLALVVAGECVLRYDNESGKGDHRHVMAGQGPVTIREVARRVERDVKAVHGDVHALIAAGLLERIESGRVAFPFDAIRVEFTLRAA